MSVPSGVANLIVVSVWWTYFAIATGIIGLGVTVTGVIGWVMLGVDRSGWPSQTTLT
jgi:hypothetical protein